MLKMSAAILGIVICSMADQCAGYETVKDRPLSVLLVPFPAPSHMMGMATLGEELIHTLNILQNKHSQTNKHTIFVSDL